MRNTPEHFLIAGSEGASRRGRAAERVPVVSTVVDHHESRFLLSKTEKLLSLLPIKNAI